MEDRLKKGVLLLAYGSPDKLDDIEEYLIRIRGGKLPDKRMVNSLKEKYIKIGGKSPLKEITLRQKDKLKKLLPENFEVFIGMKNSRPFIEEAVNLMKERRILKAWAILLSPFYSEFNISDYFKRIENVKDDIEFKYVKGFYDHPLFIEIIKERIEEEIKNFDNKENVFFIFTAHSLPKKFLKEDDPYEKQIKKTAFLIAERLSLKNFEVAYQSAPKNEKGWLSPSVFEVIREIKEKKFKNVLVIPFGFVCDHLEILYDIDIELKEFASNLGLNLKRIRSINDNDKFIRLLYELVME